jgi:hypothetical protein
MLQKEHEKFLDLIVRYYNCREDWMSNNTVKSGITYRKTLKEFVAVCRDMMKGIQEIQNEKRKEYKKIYAEKGSVPRKAKPKERPVQAKED